MSKKGKKEGPNDPVFAVRVPKAPLVVFAHGLLALGGTGVLSLVLAEKGLAKVVLCALFTEWMCGRAGVSWVSASQAALGGKATLRLASFGFALGAGVSLAALAAGVATGALTPQSQAASYEGMFFSLLSAVFFAIRAELTEHGLVFAMLFSRLSNVAPETRRRALVLVGLASSLAGGLGRGERGLALATSGCVGALTSLCFGVDGGALRAISVRAGITFFLGSFARLGPVAILTGGTKALAASPEANVFACVAALAAAGVLEWRAFRLVPRDTHARTERA